MSVAYNSKHRYKIVFCSVFKWLDGWIGPAIAYGWGCERSLSNVRYLSCHPLFLLLLYPGMVWWLLFGVPG